MSPKLRALYYHILANKSVYCMSDKIVSRAWWSSYWKVKRTNLVIGPDTKEIIQQLVKDLIND